MFEVDRAGDLLLMVGQDRRALTLGEPAKFSAEAALVPPSVPIRNVLPGIKTIPAVDAALFVAAKWSTGSSLCEMDERAATPAAPFGVPLEMLDVLLRCC